MSRPKLDELPRFQKLALLAILYFSQGVPFGLFMQALPVVLREQGVSLEAIGFSGLLALPWALKFLWSPWVDRTPPGGPWPRRKGWLVPIQLVTALLFFGLAWLQVHQSLGLLLGAVFLVNFLNATQDIATDGLAVDLLEVDERGAGNGLQVGGYRVGMIVGGAGVLVLIEYLGWTVGLTACGGILLLALLPLLAVRETRTTVDAPEPTSGWRRLGSLGSFFERDWALHVVAVAAVVKFGEAFATGMLRPMLVDRDYSMGDVGVMLGVVGFTAGLLGAAGGGWIGDRFDRRRAFCAAVAIQILGVALYIPLSLARIGYLQTTVIIGVEHFAGGVATVVLFACMMDWSRTEHSGSDYTLLASVVVISTGTGQTVSGISAQSLGYTPHFGLALALTLIGGLIAVHLFIRAQQLTRDFAEPVP